MSEKLPCKYASKNEWGPTLDCNHPKGDGFCSRETCPKRRLKKEFRAMHNDFKAWRWFWNCYVIGNGGGKQMKIEETCRLNKKNDCNDCEYEGCTNYGASLEEGDIEESERKETQQ